MFRAFAAVSILALTVTAAQAADSVIAVKFSDLDLSKPSDVRTLQARVQEAANKACGQLQLSFPAPQRYSIRIGSRTASVRPASKPRGG